MFQTISVVEEFTRLPYIVDERTSCEISGRDLLLQESLSHKFFEEPTSQWRLN